jgi:hypothetical protein
MGRIMIIALAGLVVVTVPGMTAAGEDRDARLAREDDEVALVLSVDDDDDDPATGNTGSRDSIDTTADRSRSRDRSGDKTGGGNGLDRSRSVDRSRDNTNDHSVGTTTND